MLTIVHRVQCLDNLSANYIGIISRKQVITDSAPGIIDADLHSALKGVSTIR